MAAEGSGHGGHSWAEELLAQDETAAEDAGQVGEAPKSLEDEEVIYPAIEQRLRSWYYRQVSRPSLIAQQSSSCCTSSIHL